MKREYDAEKVSIPGQDTTKTLEKRMPARVATPAGIWVIDGSSWFSNQLGFICQIPQGQVSAQNPQAMHFESSEVYSNPPR